MPAARATCMTGLRASTGSGRGKILVARGKNLILSLSSGNVKLTMPITPRKPRTADSSYAWWRLAVSLALSTIGGVGLWSAVVVLPTIETEFGVDRGGASLPYTAAMVGFAIGGVLMGRLADRFGIMLPLLVNAPLLGLGFIAAAFT